MPRLALPWSPPCEQDNQRGRLSRGVEIANLRNQLRRLEPLPTSAESLVVCSRHTGNISHNSGAVLFCEASTNADTPGPRRTSEVVDAIDADEHAVPALAAGAPG